MNTYLLGIDVGTTSTKTLLVREDGREMYRASAGYTLHVPQPGYSEQNAEDWWQAIIHTVHEILRESGVEPCAIRALSLSLQGGTSVPVDEKYRPVRPAIVWNDVRCEEQRMRFKEWKGAQYMYERSGWTLSNSNCAMASAWMWDNERDVHRRIVHFLSVPDYISYRMTGRPVVDISDAGINQLCDIRTMHYDESLLEFAHLREEQLPEILPSGQFIGNLTPQAAEELGLTTETAVITGAHDQYAVALGAGLTGEGQVLIGSGTTWVVTMLSREPSFSRGFCQSISATEGMWGNLVSIFSGGICLEWLRKNLFNSDDGPMTYETLNREAAHSRTGAGGLLFYPYFRGAGFPNSDYCSRAALLGLDLSHNRADIIRSVMEGVACQTAWALESFDESFGIRELKLAGGATNSPLWVQIIADITGLPIQIPALPDLGCVGAAILAGTGSGLYRDNQEGFRRIGMSEEVIYPNPECVAESCAMFQRYKRLAPGLQGLYQDKMRTQ